VAAQQNNLPVLSLYCNSFFIRDVDEEFGLISVYLFDILPAVLSRKVKEKSDFFCLESGNSGHLHVLRSTFKLKTYCFKMRLDVSFVDRFRFSSLQKLANNCDITVSQGKCSNVLKVRWGM